MITKTATYKGQPTFFGMDYVKKSVAGKVRINYSTFGMQMPGRSYNSGDYRYAFNGMEKDDEVSGSGNSYTAEFWQYDSRLGRRWNIDPVVKEWESPYATFSGNPILFIDPKGDNANPIYDKSGDFLGTDDKGLEGEAIVMDEKDFTQGMSHKSAMEKGTTMANLPMVYSNAFRDKIQTHQSGLSSRPDWDGFVGVDEGVEWARTHVGALDNPTPDNMLYINSSTLDFGNLSTSDFQNVNTSEPQNLLTKGNLATASYNATLRGTVYALGRVDMVLTNRDARSVVIVNDYNLPANRATDYDWNTGGGFLRNSLINGERSRTGLNDTHGFRAFYYGTGTLNE